MAIGARSCFVNSWRISHFGINPVRGGNPPRDNRTRGVEIVRIGILAHVVARELMCVVRVNIKEENSEKVIRR